MKKQRQEAKQILPNPLGEPRIELMGNECLVDGLEGIIEYSSSKIQINLGKQKVTFYGDNLCINSFTREGVIVEGLILSMEFSDD